MIRKCSVCGKEIDDTREDYVKVLDNYLQVKYFETDELNCFCSYGCLHEYVSADTIFPNDYHLLTWGEILGETE